MSSKSKVLIGLDVGSSAVRMAAAEISPRGEPILRAYSSCVSQGMRKGVVINMELAVEAIQRALHDIEIQLGQSVRSVVLSLAGSHIHGIESHGVVGIRGKEIYRSDIERVIDAAKTIPIAPDRELLHVLPQEFMVDGQGDIRDPLGMSGVRLEARVHMITGSVASAQHLVKCANRAGLAVHDVVFGGLVSTELSLLQEEKDVGVCLLDIGGGTTKVVAYDRGAICYTAVLPIGGHHVTNDIANTMRTPVHAAEHMKIQYGRALSELVNDADPIEVASSLDKPSRLVSRQLLAAIIQARYEELFDIIVQNLERQDIHDNLRSGVVIVGGGAKLRDIETLAEKRFRLPARVGSIQPDAGASLADMPASPEYASILGLLRFSARVPAPYQKPLVGGVMMGGGPFSGNRPFLGNNVYGAAKRAAHWFREYF